MSGNSRIIRSDRFTMEQAVYPSGLYMSPHTDKLPRISVILNGELVESDGFEQVIAKAGSLVIKPNHVIHENTFGNKTVRSLSISFNDESLFNKHFNKWQWINHPKINVFAIRLWTEMQHSKSDAKRQECLNNFFSVVTTLIHKASAKQLYWIEDLKDLIRKNLSEGEKVSELAKKLSLHRVYLSRTFKKNYGVSPVEFRKYAKLSSAFLDLSLSSKCLAAVAFDAGFSDQSHMNREFRKYIGCSPARFRQMMNGN